MADQTILVSPGASGLKFDLTELTVGANTVERERVNISDPTDAAGLAKVISSAPAGTEYAVVTRPILAALPAGTNVIGHVIADSGSTTAVTGNVTVVQGTGTNLHTVVDSGTVTANIGTTNGLALDASVTGLEVAQASVTSGQKGILALGAVTTAAPSYTTAQTDPLSLDTSGNLRVSLKDSPSNTNNLNVNLAASAATVTVSGTVTTTPPVNASTNVTQFGANNVVTGTGAGGLGIPRVTVSSDSVVGIGAGSAVIGHVIADSGSTTAVTGNVTVVQATGTNLHAVLDTGSTTAATQATGTNLHTVTDATSVTTATLNAETTKVIGTVRIQGNVGGVMDAAQNAAAPANELVTGAVYNTTIPALTAGNASAIQVDSTGSQYINNEGRKATYSAVANSTTTPTFTAAAGVIAVMPGSASKTIRVTRVEVTLSTSGTAAIETISLIKTSAAPTGGTSSAMTIVKHDSGFGNATAAPLLYTVAPTAGTAVGFMRCAQFNDQSAALPGAATWLWTFGDGRAGASAIVLRGTAETLEINLGAAVATQSAAVSFEFTEE